MASCAMFPPNEPKDPNGLRLSKDIMAVFFLTAKHAEWMLHVGLMLSPQPELLEVVHRPARLLANRRASLEGSLVGCSEMEAAIHFWKT